MRKGSVRINIKLKRKENKKENNSKKYRLTQKPINNGGTGCEKRKGGITGGRQF